MEEQIKRMLGEVIMEEINNISKIESGTEEKSRAVEDVAKLYKLRIEESKIEADLAKDKQLKQEQLDSQDKDRYFRYGVEAAGIVLPLVFYAVWMRKGLKFEETGTFTSNTFKGLIQKFKPTKK